MIIRSHNDVVESYNMATCMEKQGHKQKLKQPAQPLYIFSSDFDT